MAALEDTQAAAAAYTGQLDDLRDERLLTWTDMDSLQADWHAARAAYVETVRPLLGQLTPAQQSEYGWHALEQRHALGRAANLIAQLATA